MSAERSRPAGVYQGTFTVPHRYVRLAKIAAINDDKPLGQWVGDLVTKELRRLKLVESAPDADRDEQHEDE
jgi:hypothetical protein